MYIARVSLEKLDSQFRTDVCKLLQDSPYTWYILEANRTFERSRELYNHYIKYGYPRAAPPGYSAHNYGMAIDIVLDLDNDTHTGLQPSWNTNLKEWLWLFVKCKLHPRLKSGITFGDGAHIERYNWRKIVTIVTN